MRITIFGTGYVGLVTGACLAEVGHDVVCIDVDAARVRGLNAGVVPIHEPGLEPMVRNNIDQGRLRFTTDASLAVAHGEVAFIAVGTPQTEDGGADLQYVLAAATTIAEHMAAPLLVANKSTVPVGTAARVRDRIGAVLASRGADISFEVVSNPEFLKEGAAVEDFLRPARIVIGSSSRNAVDTLYRLYAPLNRNRDRILSMDERSAELTKYAANAMLATKISFMNEMACIAEQVGADIEMVRQGLGSDPRIGWHFIYAGSGYGGSCLPKDVRALERIASEHGCGSRILAAVEAVNERQKQHLFDLVERHYGDASLADKTFAVWGLAFKPDTDDMREAASRQLLERLWRAGARARAFDPEALGEARRIFGDRRDLCLCDSASAALEGADALIVLTEWKQFRSPDLPWLRSTLKDGVVFDGRNIFNPDELEAAGLAYYGIGRGRSVTRPSSSP